MIKLAQIEDELLAQFKREYPQFKQGDMIKVHYKIREKDKERIHPVAGVVIKTQGALHRKSFTLRRISFGEAYEVTFPYYSPNIAKIEVMKLSKRKARRKRIYYIRKRIGKKAFIA